MNIKLKRILKILLFLIILTIFMILSIKILNSINYECFLKKYFNIKCVGCGATRMFTAILNLEFYKAFMYNPLYFIFLIIFIVYIFYVCICIMFNINYKKPNIYWVYALTIICVLYMFIRNVPGINI